MLGWRLTVELKHIIRNRRKELSITQKQLAVLSGTSQQTITDIESGRNKGSKYLIQIAEALDLSNKELSLDKSKNNFSDKLISNKLSLLVNRSSVNYLALIQAMSEVEKAVMYLDSPLDIKTKAKITIAYYETCHKGLTIEKLIELFADDKKKHP